MSIKRTIITALVVMAVVAVVAPGVNAQTLTVAQLMAQIQALTAQLQQLSGTTAPAATPSGTVPAACSGVTFTRNLVVGSTGSDVKCLQSILNLSPSTQVSATGAGSPGYETMTFGPKTLAAVRVWQAAQGLTPANQIGPMSRAKLNAWLGGAATTPVTPGTPVTPVTPGQPVIVTPSGTISAMLASDSPAMGAIVNGQSTADLMHIAFSGMGTVTSVTLQRTGISDQNALTNVYLYDGNQRITDGYSFNVSGQLVMNGLSIVVNGSHTISVKADVANATSPISESSIAVTMTSYTGNSAVTTSNVMGNTMNIVAGNLATASIGTNSVATATVNAGTSSYTFWSAPVQVNVRSVLLKVANFRMIGSAPLNALGNIKMFVDGIDTGKTATVTTVNGSNYAMFDLTSAPISLTTGSHTIDMRADIQNGTNRNLTVSVQQPSDLVITDPQVGVNIAVTGTPNSAGQINISTGTVTVNTDPTFTAMTNIPGGSTNSVIGRLTIHAYGEDVKVNTLVITPVMTTTGTTQAVTSTTPTAVGGVEPSTTLTITTAGLGYTAVPSVTVATCVTQPTTTGTISAGTVTSLTLVGGAGCTNAPEAVTIAAPTFGTVGGLNNVTLYFNDSQIGSQQNWPVTGGNLTFSLGSQMIAPAGQDSTLEVRADLQTTTNVAYTAGTVGIVLPYVASGANYNNAQGQSSENTVSVPATTVTPNTLSIQTGLLAVSVNSAFLGQSISPNTTGTRIGSFTVQNQSTSESIRLTSLKLVTTDSFNAPTVGFTAVTGTNVSGVSNLGALRTSDTTGSGSNPIQPSGSGTATSTDTFSVNDTLAPGAQMTVDVFANVGSDAAGYVQTNLTVASIGVVDNLASAGTQQTGQIMTVGSGQVNTTPTIVVSSTTPAQYVAAGGSTAAVNAAQATFNFISSNGSSTITELKFTVSGTDANPSQSVTNVCVGTVCAQPVSGIADLTGLQLLVPNGGGGLTQNVETSFSPVGTTGIAPNTNTVLTLSYVKYQSGSGSTTTFSPTIATPVLTLVGSYPTLAINQTSPASGLILGAENQIGQVTITANAKGAIKVHQIVFKLGFGGFTAGANPGILNSTPARLANGSTTVTGSSCTVDNPADNDSSKVTCTFTSNGNAPSGTYNDGVNNQGYAYDYLIPAGGSQTFNLFGTNHDGAVASGATGSISTAVSNTTTDFQWDDTSTNGGAYSTQLTGGLIYGFPTNSYSIHQ